MGVRNEEARARRRRKLKEQLSLSSVPDNELEYGARPSPSQKPTLSNHFLWTVLERSQVGDGTFPHLSQYHEKPDIYGRDFEKVTYVLYVGKGGEVEKDSMPKATQTSFISGSPPRMISWSDEQVKKQMSPTVIEQPRELIEEVFEEIDEDKSVEEVKKARSEEILSHRRRKRPGKLISNFYYKPKERSRSPQKIEPEHILKSGGSDIENNRALDVPKIEEDVKQKVVNEAGKRRGYKQDKWKLRAGADANVESLRGSQIVDSKCEIIRANILRFDSMRFFKGSSTELLLNTPSGTNRYLYVPNRNKKWSIKDSESNLKESS